MEIRDLFLIPADKLNPRRLYFFDGLRAFALLTMVFTHGMKNWINPSLETPVTLFLKSILTNIPAPLFLSLVGAAYVLSRNARLRKNTPRRDIFRYYLKRSLFLLFLAYLYKFIDVLFRVAPSDILYWRVDVLNMISLALLFIAVYDHLFHRFPWMERGLLWTALFFVLPAPAILTLTLPSWVPWSLGLYLTGKAPDAFFNIFPYAGYVFLGAWLTLRVLGGWPLKKDRAVNALAIGLALAAAGGWSVKEHLLAPGFACDFFSHVSQYGRNFLFVVFASWAAFHFQRKAGFGPLLLLGGNTLVAYWIHAKIVFIYYKEYLGVSTWQTSFLLLLKTYAATLILTFAWINIKAWYQAKKASNAKDGENPRSSLSADARKILSGRHVDNPFPADNGS